jgi:hypothetical protein
MQSLYAWLVLNLCNYVAIVPMGLLGNGPWGHFPAHCAVIWCGSPWVPRVKPDFRAIRHVRLSEGACSHCVYGLC